MEQSAWLVALALMFMAQYLVLPVTAQTRDPEHREAMDSLLKAMFEAKMRSREADSDHLALPAFSKRPERVLSAPLAHPKPPTSDSSRLNLDAPLSRPTSDASSRLNLDAARPSFHLLKVTGAQASLGSTGQSDSAPSAAEAGKRYEYLRELRRQFEDKQDE